MLCFGRRTLTVLLPAGEARRRSLQEGMMRLASSGSDWADWEAEPCWPFLSLSEELPLTAAYKSWKSLTKKLTRGDKNNYKIKITKGDYDKGEDIGGAFGWR